MRTIRVLAPARTQVKWDDVGGLGSIKQEILDVIELPLKHPEVFGKGVKRRAGILLYGPPGTGERIIVLSLCGRFAAALNLSHHVGQ